MLKFGTLLAVATTSSSAVASPYVVSYANINIDPKEYSTDSFTHDVRSYLEYKYEGSSVDFSVYYFMISDLLTRGEVTFDQDVQKAIENKIELAYEYNPFNNSSSLFDPSDDMRWNIANVITNWFESNPSYQPGQGQSTVELVNAINGISFDSTSQVFDDIEANFNNWKSDITGWGVNPNHFNDIEGSMQIVADSGPIDPNDYYMDINEFYIGTSAEIMNGQDYVVIEDEIIFSDNNNHSIWLSRLNELQFNLTENQDAFELVRQQQENTLRSIVQDFANTNDFEKISSDLSNENISIYENYIDSLIDEVATSMRDMQVKETIGESYVDISSSDLSQFFEESDVANFMSDYDGVEVNVNTTGTGDDNVEVVFQILDSDSFVIHEEIVYTKYDSDVFQVEEYIQTMEWIYFGNDSQHLIDDGIDDENVPLTNDQLDFLFQEYIVGVAVAYSSVNVHATYELIPVVGEDMFDFVVTFDISKDSSQATVIRSETIALFDNELSSTIENISEQFDDVVISELLLKMNGISSDVDLKDVGNQATYLSKLIQHTNPTVDIDELILVYDESNSYIGGVTTVWLSLTNNRSGETITRHGIQVGINRAIDQAQVIMDGSTFQNLYKDYVRTWYATDYDIKSFSLFNWEVVPEYKWVYENMLDSIKVNQGIASAEGTVQVDLMFTLVNMDNNESSNWVITTETSEYDLPIDEAESVFSAYEFRDPLNIDSQLAAISNPASPTTLEMDNMIFNFEDNVSKYSSLEVDGSDPITTSIGGIQDMGSNPYNVLTLADNHGNFATVIIQYDTNLVSGAEIMLFETELIEHMSNLDYILSELVDAENILESNHINAAEQAGILLISYRTEAPTKTNEEWMEYTNSVMTQLYMGFGNAWFGEGSNTHLIIQEIESDYPEGIPSSIQNRIDDYTGGITIMPYPVDYNDFDKLDDVVDVILSLTKATFLIDPIEVDLAGKIMIFASGVTLSVVSGMALISTFRILITQRKLRQLDDPTIRYSSPKKLVAFSAISAIVAAAASITLMVYIFITKGGL